MKEMWSSLHWPLGDQLVGRSFDGFLRILMVFSMILTMLVDLDAAYVSLKPSAVDTSNPRYMSTGYRFLPGPTYSRWWMSTRRHHL